MGDILTDIADVAAELADVRQHTERVPFWDAARNKKFRTHTTTQRGLLAQLYESVIPGSSGDSGARVHPSSRPPLALEALSAHTVITLAVAQWCWNLRIEQRDTVEGNVRALVGAATQLDDTQRRRLAADMRRWRTMCAVMTAWERVEAFPQVPCMCCGWMGPDGGRGALRLNVTTGRAYCTNQDADDGGLVCGAVWSQQDGSIQVLGRYISEFKAALERQQTEGAAA